MTEVDAREELGELVRAFRLYLERQARMGVHALPAAPMPLPAPAIEPEGTLESTIAGTPEAMIDAQAAPASRQHPAAPASRQHPAAPASRQHRAAVPDMDRDAPMPSFTAALMAVLDEPAPGKPAPARPAPGAASATAATAPPRMHVQRITLEDVRAELGDCQRCKLARGRTSIVFGVGDARAPLLFVGGAPGFHEDQRGEPFVGAAGQLLDRMIEAMGWTRDTVYLVNMVKCRPPDDRAPQPDEVAACEPFLFEQIALVAPRLIIALGEPAAQLLLRSDAPIRALRGRFQEFRGIRVMPTFDPEFLLRNPERKRETWADLKLVIAELERLGISSPRPPRA
jgi:uracil-DNA glycosylase family 4